MEKEKYSDPLDDYVRKSFEDYEEDPAPDMWGKIERELEPDDSSRRAFWWFRWPAMAVGLLLLGSLLGGYVYYVEKNGLRRTAELPGPGNGVTSNRPMTQVEEKRSEQTTGQSQPSDGVSQGHAVHPSGSSSAGTVSNRTSTSPVLQNSPQASRFDPDMGRDQVVKTSESVRRQRPLAEFAEKNRPQNELPRAQALHSPTLSIPIFGPAPDLTTLSRPMSGSNLHTTPPEGNMVLPNPTHHLSTEKTTDFAENPVLPNDSLNASSLTSSRKPVAELTPLDPRLIPLDAISEYSLRPTVSPIQPARTPSGWYVGLHVTPVLSFEKSTAAATDRPRLNFISESENPDFSMDAWLKIGKKIRPRFGLESGLGYYKASTMATHTAVLQLRDGSPVTVTGRVRDFRYTVDSYSGSATVSLRMEQTDNLPVSITELLRIKIATTEQVEMLRVPLLAVFRVGTGRLQRVVKAGVTGNFFLRNQLYISTRTSQNLRFQPSPDNGSYSIQLEQPKRFFAGYWVSGGLEWKWTRHISLVAEPCFSGNFVRKDGNGRQLPNRVLVGGSLGVNYEL